MSSSGLQPSLSDQLQAIGVSPEMHDRLVDATVGRVSNPTDSFGRTAYEVGLMRSAGLEITPASRCTNCGESLVWCRGVPDQVTPYFRHRSKTKCPGGFMTPWHAALQVACSAHGFDVEFSINIDGAKRRLDAYNPRRKLCIEFVSSLSAEYAIKHTQLADFPIQTAWVFNSGARFATSAFEERVDAKALVAGVLRVQNLFTAYGGAREIIETIGRANCYTIYRGLVFGCVGLDLWQCLPLDNPLQGLCLSDYGFNFQLYKAGKHPRRNLTTGEETGASRVVRSRYPLPSGHRVDPEHVIEELQKLLRCGRLKAATTTLPGLQESQEADEQVAMSHKMPSDNRAAVCDGSVRRHRVTNNLTINEVSKQVAEARQAWDGSDFDPWPTDRDTEIEVDEPENLESLLIADCQPAADEALTAANVALPVHSVSGIADAKAFQRRRAVTSSGWTSIEDAGYGQRESMTVAAVNRILMELGNERPRSGMPSYYLNNY